MISTNVTVVAIDRGVVNARTVVSHTLKSPEDTRGENWMVSIVHTPVVIEYPPTTAQTHARSAILSANESGF
jgi:hypothetical protein